MGLDDLDAGHLAHRDAVHLHVLAGAQPGGVLEHGGVARRAERGHAEHHDQPGDQRADGQADEPGAERVASGERLHRHTSDHGPLGPAGLTSAVAPKASRNEHG